MNKNCKEGLEPGDFCPVFIEELFDLDCNQCPYQKGMPDFEPIYWIKGDGAHVVHALLEHDSCFVACGMKIGYGHQICEDDTLECPDCAKVIVAIKKTEESPYPWMIKRIKPLIPTGIAGTQVAYIPDHVLELIRHNNGEIAECYLAKGRVLQGIEMGFITSRQGDYAYCRFYSPAGYLRTTTCSERCSFENLYPYNHHSQKEIIEAIKNLS